MGHKTSHARLVQRKTGAGYQVSLLKIRGMREKDGDEAVNAYLDKVRDLPDAPVAERAPVRCLHCLNELNNCRCKEA